MRPKIILVVIVLLVVFGIVLTTALSQAGVGEDWWKSPQGDRAVVSPTAVETAQPETLGWGLPTPRPPGAPIFTPTPDAPHMLPQLRTDPDQYMVQPGDTLGQIASRYGVSVPQLVAANALTNPDILSVGQVLTIPAPTPEAVRVDFKVIPDSELVYGPYSIYLDLDELIGKQAGYLASYREVVDDNTLTGAQVVRRVAQDYAVNPRLLLAVLEYQSGWMSNPAPSQADREYPLGFRSPQRKGLFRQLSWAANNLNRGYYVWRVDGVGAWVLADGKIVPIAPTINAGTAGVQHFFALLYPLDGWLRAVSAEGVFAVYQALFGYPFDYGIEPALPPNLAQPPMQLPFEVGKVWAFTSGPHGAWGDGAAWAALDFAPPGDSTGCVQSDDWVVAVADGIILRAENGAVIQDLDGDGYEQTGWVVLYMHIETRDRVQPGMFLRAGERIGHPSCEGGVSTGTHTHLARRYNGEWIPADQDIPFVLDGWVSQGLGQEYDGYLQRDGVQIEAYAGLADNQIQR